MNEEYLTIKEYAEIRGVSKNAVYKRLDSTLHKYCVEVDGKKVLKRQVLEDEGLNEKSEPSIEFSTPTPTVDSTPTPSIIEKQLEVKDNQIAELHAEIKDLHKQLKEKDQFIKEQAKDISKFIEQSNVLLQTNQKLLSELTKPEEPDPEKEPEEIINPVDIEVVEKRKGFLSKLFNKG